MSAELEELLRPPGEVTVRPVPEHLADAELTEVYQDLKATLAVPWVGVITQAVAHYRPFFIEAWKRFQPSARTHYFERHCDAIRLRAWEEMAGAFDIRPQSQQLTALGYSDRELAEIRATLDIFDYGNPKYLVLATAIKESLCKGRRLGGREGRNGRDKMPRSPICQTGPIPVMVEEHHALSGLQAVYEDIKATLELPFVNSDYKAMARWPSYLELAWGELKPCITTVEYQRVRQHIHEQALSTVESLPHEYFMDQAMALEAKLSQDQISELVDVISLFQWLLSGLIINVTHFKLSVTANTGCTAGEKIS
tara:strand:- start:5922 stop:6851 length:930 start_codon:yes stop_codon:yes gene_type:complete